MKKTKKAFTLVELVIVIAVIAILAAVLIPTFAGILERARENAALQRATSVRDEFISGKNIVPISELENYIIEIDEKYAYIIGADGTLTRVDGVDESYVVTDNSTQDAIIYKPIDSGASEDGEEDKEDEEIVTSTLASGLYVGEYNTQDPSQSNLLLTWTELTTGENPVLTIENSKITYLDEGQLSNYLTDSTEFSMVIDSSITTICSESMWFNNYTLLGLELSNSIIIEEYAFDYYSFTLFYEDENGILYLGNDKCNYVWLMFFNSVENVVIKDTCIGILEYAFDDGNATLTSVEIPQSVKYVNEFAFTNCENLANISIIKPFEYIGYGAFTNACITALSGMNPDEYPSCFTYEVITDGYVGFYIGYTGNEDVSANPYYIALLVMGDCLNEKTEVVLSTTFSAFEQFYEGISYMYDEITIPKNVHYIESYFRSQMPNLNNLVIDENNENYYFDGVALYNKGALQEIIVPNYAYLIRPTVTIKDTTYNVTTLKMYSIYEIDYMMLFCYPTLTNFEMFSINDCSNLVFLHKQELTNYDENLSQWGSNISFIEFDASQSGGYISAQIDGNTFEGAFTWEEMIENEGVVVKDNTLVSIHPDFKECNVCFLVVDKSIERIASNAFTEANPNFLLLQNENTIIEENAFPFSANNQVSVNEGNGGNNICNATDSNGKIVPLVSNDDIINNYNSLVLNNYKGVSYVGTATNPHLWAIGFYYTTYEQYMMDNGQDIVIERTLADTCIGVYDCAFLGFSDLEKITLPESVKYIHAGAFVYCDYLTEIIIEGSIEYIGHNAIDVNTLLNNIGDLTNMPSCFTFEIIDNDNGIACLYLANKTNPYHIALMTFGDCLNEKTELIASTLLMQYVLQPTSVEDYDIEANGLTITKDVKFISPFTFVMDTSGSNTIEKVNIDENNPYYYFDGKCLYRQNKLVCYVSTSYDAYTVLKSVKIGEKNYTVDTIATNAFIIRCPEVVTFDENIITFENSALNACKSGNGLLILGTTNFNQNLALFDCENVIVKDVGFVGLINLDTSETIAWEDLVKKGIVTVENNKITAFSYNTNDSFELYLDKSITGIKSNSMIEYQNLTAIYLSNNCVLENDSIYVYSLTNAKIENEIVYVGNYSNPYMWAIGLNDTSITEATLNTNCFGVYNYAFGDTNSIQTLNIPESVKYVLDYAFCGCYDTISINITTPFTFIGDYVFWYATIIVEDMYNEGSLDSSFTYENDIIYLGYAGNEEIEANPYYICYHILSTATSVTLNKNTTVILPECVDYAENLEEFIITADNTFDSYAYYSDGRAIYRDNGLLKYVDKSVDQEAYTLLTSYTYKETTYTVDTILHDSFESNYGVNSVVIPNGYKNIEMYAFYYCEALENITLPSSLKVIGDSAFNGCLNLTEIELKDGLTNIEEYVFSCSGLTKITVPSSITYLGGYFISDCESLEEVEIPSLDEDAYIGTHLFSDCANLTTATINLTYIPSYTFYNCSALTTLTLNENLTEINENAFYGCSSLTDVGELKQLTFIGSSAFYGSGLTQFIVHETLTTISTKAFYNCNDLALVINFSDLNIVAGATSYGYIAYYADEVRDTYEKGVTATVDGIEYVLVDNIAYAYIIKDDSLKTASQITLSQSVTFSVDGVDTEITTFGLETGVFKGLTALTTLNATNLVVINKNALYGCTSLSTITGIENLTKIGEYAFYNCQSLTSFTFTSNMTSVETNAFNGCTGLVDVVVSNGTTNIFGTDAFANCTNLKTVYNLSSLNIVAGAETYGKIALNATLVCENYALVDDFEFVMDNGETYLINYKGTSTDLVLPSSVTFTKFGETTVTSYKIKDEAFKSNTSITSLKDEGGAVVEIGTSAFSSCTSLITLTGFANLVEIKDYAFAGCSKLATIPTFEKLETIGASAFTNLAVSELTGFNAVTSIGQYAFAGSSTLTTVNGFNALTVVGNQIFGGCSKITSIEGFNSVTTIGDNGFAALSGLLTVSGFEKVTTLGVSAFAACSKLTTLTGFTKVEVIGNNAFAGDSKLTTLVVGENTTSIGESAYGGCSALAVELTISEKFTSIGSGAFASTGITKLTLNANISYASAFNGSTNLTTVVLNENITSLSNNMFSGCSKLTTINLDNIENFGENSLKGTGLTTLTLGDKVKSVGNSAFSGSALTEVNITNNSITYGTGVFSDCTSLTTISLVDTMTTIPESMFSGLTSLKNITLPNSLQTIGTKAFYNNTALTIITLPTNLTKINSEAFYGCTNLAYVVNNSSLEISLGTQDTSNGYVAYYSVSGDYKAIATRKVNDYEFLFTLDSSNKATLVEYLTPELGGVTLPSSVTFDLGGGESYTAGTYAIGDKVFYESSLTQIKMENNVKNVITTIGQEAFANDRDNVEDFDNAITTIGTGFESVTTISKAAFYNCGSLDNFPFEKVVSLGDYAFYNTDINVDVLKLPSTLTELGTSVFGYSTGFKYADFSQSQITEIHLQTFYQNSDLLGVILNEGLLTYGTDVVSECSNLKFILIPSTITSCGSNYYTKSTITIYYASTASCYFGTPNVVKLTDYAFDNNVLYYIDESNNAHLVDVLIPTDTITLPQTVVSSISGESANVVVDSVALTYETYLSGSKEEFNTMTASLATFTGVTTIYIPTSITVSEESYICQNYSIDSTEEIESITYNIWK